MSHMKCPKCGSEEEFKASVITHDTETQYFDSDGLFIDGRTDELETFWVEHAECDSCGHGGDAGEFGLTNTYTVFCTREDDVLSTWISFVEAKDAADAREKAIDKYVEDHECQRHEVVFVGLAKGHVDIIEWNDPED